MLDTNALRNELLNVAKTEIRNGIPPADLKNQLKGIVRQRAREQILSVQTKPEKSVAGFFSNLKRNVKEVVQGLGALGGMLIGGVINTAKEPFLPGTQSYVGGLIKDPKGTLQETFETSKKVGRLLADQYKEYRHPLEKIYEDPFDVLLDVTAVSGILGAVAKGAKLPAVAGVLGAPARALTFAGLAKGTRAVISKLPGGTGMLEGFDNWNTINKVLNTAQSRHIIARNRAIQMVDDSVKDLSESEVNSLIPAAEGLITIVEPSDKFQRALGVIRSLAKERETFGIQIGKLTAEQVELRKFAPLAKQLGIAEGGKLTEEGLVALKRLIPDADPVYVQHFFADKPSSFAEFFLNTSPAKSFKPSFLKQFKGVKGFLGEAGTQIGKEQLGDILKREAIQTLKWKNNINLIDTIVKHPSVKPFEFGAELLPDHVVFAPDGLLRFYGGKIKLADSLAKAVANKGKFVSSEEILTVFKDAIDNVFPNEAAFMNATKEFVGVTKKGVRLFQVPKAVARQLNKAVQPSNPLVKIFWDKPMDAFRYAVLALAPRWLVNNLVGNTTFSLVAGDLFKLKPVVYKEALKRGLIPDEVFTGIFRTERSTSGKLGKVSEMLGDYAEQIGRDSPWIAEAVVGVEKVGGTVFKPIRTVGDLSFRINELTDDFFRGTHFVNESLKLARKKFLVETVGSFDDTMKLLERAVKDPALAEEAVASVNRWFYGASNLTNFERRVMRRIIPFYTWQRWITTYSLHLALNAPARANLLRNMGQVSFIWTEQDKLPDFMRGALPIGTSPDGSIYYLRTSGANPFSTVTDFMTFGLAGVALQSAGPGIKTVYEWATGKEAFPVKSGREFTREDIQQLRTGRLYRFDPESGEVEEVNEVVRPNLVELLLRNYIPQYVLLEEVLTGGRRRYTAEGLITILADLRIPESERSSIVKDAITMQSEKDLKRIGFKALSLGGAPIYEFTPELQKATREEIQEATATIFNKENPVFKRNFRAQLKDRIIKELQKGTSKQELKLKVQQWIRESVKKSTIR